MGKYYFSNNQDIQIYNPRADSMRKPQNLAINSREKELE